MLSATTVLFENLFTRASFMILVLLVNKDVMITEDGTNNWFNKGSIWIGDDVVTYE
jgi:hypothetical protein